MYGFGGLGEVEVEIWSDVTIAGRTNDEQKGKIELLSHGPWKAKMSNSRPSKPFFCISEMRCKM